MRSSWRFQWKSLFLLELALFVDKEEIWTYFYMSYLKHKSLSTSALNKIPHECHCFIQNFIVYNYWYFSIYIQVAFSFTWEVLERAMSSIDIHIQLVAKSYYPNPENLYKIHLDCSNTLSYHYIDALTLQILNYANHLYFLFNCNGIKQTTMENMLSSRVLMLLSCRLLNVQWLLVRKKPVTSPDDRVHQIQNSQKHQHFPCPLPGTEIFVIWRGTGKREREWMIKSNLIRREKLSCCFDYC